ncbi:hypothetical protein QA943_25135 [Streptomyces sp. B21-097]|uniref:hypothetical protein n=1 Tax=Streptomyces sp. B21-097 TaxID=3039414 RepID=UPI002FEF17A4
MSTRPTPPALPVRPTRRGVPYGVRRRARRLAGAALTLVAALALTACHDGQGLRDEGPSGAGVPTGATAGPAHGHAKPGRPVVARRPCGTASARAACYRSFRAASVAQ